MARLSSFSRNHSSRRHVNFGRCKYEVQSMWFEHKSNYITLNDISQSLEGTTGDEISYMPTNYTPIAILEKLSVSYDDVLSSG